MKPAIMGPFGNIHSGKKHKDLKYFKIPEHKLRAQSSMNALLKSSVGADFEGLETSYSITLNPLLNLHCIGLSV